MRDLRPRSIGEIFDRAVRLVIGSLGTIVCIGIVTFFLPRVLCTFALEHVPNGSNAQAIRFALFYARPCFDLIYAPALMLLFADPKRFKSSTLRELSLATLRNGFISSPLFGVLAAVCSIPFSEAGLTFILRSGLISKIPLEPHILGFTIGVVLFFAGASVTVPLAIGALVTLAFVTAEAPTPGPSIATPDTIGSIEPHEMIIPYVIVVLVAALRAMLRRTLDNGQWKRTLKLATSLSLVYYFYHIAYYLTTHWFVRAHGRIWIAIWSSALLVPV
jgi:hypothetical protein